MKHPPYHLRVNKAVDRVLLVEAVRRAREIHDVRKYTYYGFGGPFLEDFRLFDQYLPEVKLVSLERNSHTFERQIFHKFTKRLKLVCLDLRTFLNSQFEPGEHDIIWLDNTDNDLARFEEFKQVLSLVNVGSIVKLTIRGELNGYPVDRGRGILSNDILNDLEDAFFRRFKEKYGGILPDNCTKDDLQKFRFAHLLQSMVKIAAQQALPASTGQTFQIVNSCFYDDQTQMFSIAGVVTEVSAVATLRNTYRNWRFANLDWAEPDRIDVPILSLKERLFLERHVPMKSRSGKALKKALGYNIDNGGPNTERKLRQYADFSKYYPQFARVDV